MLQEYFLDVNDPRQTLDAIQQHIALLDDHLVLAILLVRTIRLDYHVHLVDLSIQSPHADEPG